MLKIEHAPTYHCLVTWWINDEIIYLKQLKTPFFTIRDEIQYGVETNEFEIE